MIRIGAIEIWPRDLTQIIWVLKKFLVAYFLIDESLKAVYVSIGAYGFHALERDYEKATCAEAADEFKSFTER